MKIKRIEIASFGKFKDFVMDFSDGFNLIFGENETGKSTVMAFIALMLYGNAGTSARTDISKNLRKKYLPWSGEGMSGDMELESGGRTYRIHKDFKATAKSDKVSITDMETGEKLSLPPGTEAGKYFLGLDYQGFEKSVFGAAAESFAGEENGDIAARLSNISETGDENISPKEALSRLDKAREALVSKSGSRGRLVDINNRIEELKEQIAAAKIKDEQRNGLKREYENLQRELKALQKEAEKNRRAAEINEKHRRIKQLKNLAALVSETEKKQIYLSEKLRGGSAEEILNIGTELKRRVDIARENVRNCRIDEDEKIVSESEMKRYTGLIEELRSVQTEKTALEEKDKAGRKKIFTVIGILLAAGIVIFAVGIFGKFFLAAIAALAALGVVLALAAAVVKGKEKVRRGAENEVQRKFDEITEEISALFKSKACKNPEEFDAAYRNGIAYDEKMKIYRRAEQELKSAETSFTDFAKAYGADSVSSAEKFLEGIKKEADEAEELLKNVQSYAQTYEIDTLDKDELLNLAQDMEKELPEEEDCGDGEETERKIRSVNGRLLDIKGRLGETADIGGLERELGELAEKSEEMTLYYNALTSAAEGMAEAADEIRRSFAPKLRSRAGELMARLTNGRYSGLSVSKTYDIEVKAGAAKAYRQWRSLSRGTCAQSYLALRLAVCEMLEEGGEKIPLMLDDVLSDYDDIRAREAADFLEEYAEGGRQVIFFTCHEWLGNAKKINLI